MKELQGKRVLLFSPKFFDYEKIIKKELENLGAIVDYFDDRPNNDFLTKVFLRLKLKFLIHRKINNYYEQVYSFIHNKAYDYVFVISPETLSYKELKIIKGIQPQAKYLLYMWDSFKNKNSFNTITLFDKVYSFDYKDANEFQVNFLPLFYAHEYKLLESNDFEYDVSFIATAHSDRYHIAKEILSLLGECHTYFYFYLPSKIMYFIRKYFIKKYRYGSINDFSFLPLVHSEIIDVFKKSRSILDINHPAQDGLTMRTFECLGAKKKLITTNTNVRSYDFYHENNILIIDREKIILDKIFLSLPYMELSPEIYKKYCIEEWLKTIFCKG